MGADGNVRVAAAARVTMIDRAGRRSRLSCPALPAPFHLAGRRPRLGRARRGAIGCGRGRDGRRRCGTRARELHGDATERGSPGETVENWLVRNGQTPRLREMLWDPLALAALNQPPARPRRRRSRACSPRCSASDPRAAAIALPTLPLHRDVCGAGARLHRSARRQGPHRRAGDASTSGRRSCAATRGDERIAAPVRHRGRAVVRVRATLFDAEVPALRDTIAIVRGGWRRGRSSP